MALALALAQGSSIWGEGKQSMNPRERKWIFTWEECKRKERVRYCHLQEDSQGGESIGLPPSKRQPRRREQSVAAFDRDNQCVCVCVCGRERESKEKQERFFFMHEIYTRIIVIDLIIVKLFGVCPIVFFPARERVFHVNICVIVCNCYFRLLIFLIILFGTQQ